MELISTAWHIVAALLVFILGLLLSVLLPDYFKLGRRLGVFLYGWHTLWCLVYLWYVLNNSGDALMYYRVSFLGDSSFLDVGTHAVIAFTSIFTVLLGLSLLGVFLVFNIFGYIGLLAFAGALKAVTRNKSRQLRMLALVIILLPSVSFWSSAVGKDAISFMAMGLALWAAIELNNRGLLMAFAVLAMLFVRPHMAGMMMVGLSLAFTLHSRVPLARRLLSGLISVGAAIVIIPFGLQYAGVVEVADVDALVSYVETRQGYNQQGEGGVDISSMSLPMQMFTYMFRPLIFEARSVFQLAAAVDNIILGVLFLFGGVAIWKRRKSQVPDTRLFLWGYALLAWVVLAMTTANLGIAMRQKWMFAPVLIYLLISVMGTPQQATYHDRPIDGQRPFPRSFKTPLHSEKKS